MAVKTRLPGFSGFSLPLLASVATVAFVVSFSACSSGSLTNGTDTPVVVDGISSFVGKDDNANLTGAGATFPAPIYQAWFDDYNKLVAKNVQINYQSIGSGGGIQQFTGGTVDFGASDAPMSAAELAKAPNAVHLPMVMGSVVITYFIPGLKEALKLDGATTARIFLGEVQKWDDPAIALLNPGAKLPSKKIQVVHRSDGSGTSFVFTDYLAKVSPTWKERVGANKNPNWPTGVGGKGNEGVTNTVKQTPNSIGYVELNYAIINKLAFAALKNEAGNFVLPSLDSTAAAAAGATIPDDYRVSLTNAPGTGAYPIASMTYLLISKDSGDCGKQKPLVDMLWWVFHSKQAAATSFELNYSQLPAALLPRVEATLKSITCEGNRILTQQAVH